MAPRRVVTGIRNGKSVVLSDGDPVNLHEYKGWPGHVSSVLWTTPAMPRLPAAMEGEAAPPRLRIVPPCGGTQLMIVHLPPDSVFADPGYDPVRYAEEAGAHVDGLLQCFEPDAPGMHRTDSIDYDVVLQGEIWLELDDGVEVHLTQGDVVVQGGTRHAWRNKSAAPAVMLFVLIGADRTVEA